MNKIKVLEDLVEALQEKIVSLEKVNKIQAEMIELYKEAEAVHEITKAAIVASSEQLVRNINHIIVD